MTKPLAPRPIPCHNGAHDWTPPVRRGRKPASCPEHPLASATATVAPTLDARLDATDRGETSAETARRLMQSPAIRRAQTRNMLAARQAHLDLVPEDRSPQRQRADAEQARKDRTAATWMNVTEEVRTAPRRKAKPAKPVDPDAKSSAEDRKPFDADEFRVLPELGGRREVPRPTGRDYAETSVPEGDRKGADWISTQKRRGAFHTGHAEGVKAPLTCGECFLSSVKDFTDEIPEHRKHRAS